MGTREMHGCFGFMTGSEEGGGADRGGGKTGGAGMGDPGDGRGRGEVI